MVTSFIRQGVRSLVWVASAVWTVYWLAMFGKDFSHPPMPPAEFTAEAAAACVFIIGGFAIAFALDAAFLRPESLQSRGEH